MAVEDIEQMYRVAQHFDPERKELQRNYQGKQALKHAGISLPPKLKKLETVLNWNATYVDALNERITIDGVRLGDDTKTDDRISRWWDWNHLGAESPLVHLDAMVSRHSFVSLGFPDAADPDQDPDIPVIVPESPVGMAVDMDQKTRQIRQAAKFYGIRHVDGIPMSREEDELPQLAVHYEKNRNTYYERDERGQWRDYDADDHNLGQCTLIPFINKTHISDIYGTTEMRDVMPLTAAASRTLLNLQGAQELLAVPQRYMFGADDESFVNAHGDMMTVWEAYFGGVWTSKNPEGRAGTFPAADLSNFTEVLNQYARMVSAVTGLPPHYLGFTSDNPASADAIRSSESRLVKRAESKQDMFSPQWQKVLRLGMRMMGMTEQARQPIQILWRDPSTPTVAAMADAVVKMYMAGLLPKQAAWEKLRYDEKERKHLMALDSSDPATRFLASQPSQQQQRPTPLAQTPDNANQAA